MLSIGNEDRSRYLLDGTVVSRRDVTGSDRLRPEMMPLCGDNRCGSGALESRWYGARLRYVDGMVVVGPTELSVSSYVLQPRAITSPKPRP